MIVDSFDYIACYKGLHPNLDKAIDWLNSHTLDALENGKTIIDGENVFVNVMDADLRDADGAAFEYHRRYADLQIDITGGEGWGYTNEPGEEVGEYTDFRPNSFSMKGLPKIWSRCRWVFSRCFTFSPFLMMKFFKVCFSSS